MTLQLISSLKDSDVIQNQYRLFLVRARRDYQRAVQDLFVWYSEQEEMSKMSNGYYKHPTKMSQYLRDVPNKRYGQNEKGYLWLPLEKIKKRVEKEMEYTLDEFFAHEYGKGERNIVTVSIHKLKDIVKK